MLVYIIKSVACLAIFFAFYKLFLEKENMHQFKRFYLLGALLFSLLIPLVVFTEYVEATPAPAIQYEATQLQSTDEVINIPPALEKDVIDVAPILWGIYFVGLFFFGLKFILNLFQVLGRIRKNPKNKLARFTQVLLLEKLPPHTFFKYIFLNKSKFESNQIPKEVLLHEETHATQKHSIDVVFVELLQVIFWVNPFIYFAKKAMKLNHEFLADHAVLLNNIDATSYKNTLLSYLSPDSQYNHEPQMANSINYSSIKKRFTVMKTQTSKKAALLRSFVILPLLTLMIYGFSERKNVVQNDKEQIIELYISQTEITVNNRQVEFIDLANTIENEILPDVKLENVYVEGLTEKDLDSEYIGKIFLEIRKIDIKNIKFCTSALYTTNNISILINKEGQILIQNDLATLEDLDTHLNKIISTLSKDQKLEKVTSIIYIDNESPEKIVFQVYDILSKYSDTTIQPMESDFFKKSQDGSSKGEINPFLVTVEKNKNSIRLKCESGCKWADITLDTKAKSKYIINDYGFSEGKTLDTDKFAFTIEPTPEGVALKSLKGAAWVELSFSLGKNNSRRINHEGVGLENQLNAEKKESKLILKYDEKGKLYLNNKTILFENLLEKLGNADFIEINESTKALIDAENASDTKINELSRVLWDAGLAVENVGVFASDKKIEQLVATKKQLGEYNSLAKKYNTMLSKSRSIQIKMKDVERLKYLYSLMSDKQKADSEPFPNFPEPPPLPKAPKTPEPLKNQQNIDENELQNQLENDEIYDEVVKNIIYSKDLKFGDENTDVYPSNSTKHLTPITTHNVFNYSKPENEQTQKDSTVVQGTQYSYHEENPERPKESFVKQLIELNEKEAVFYHKGEEISFYKALDIVYNKRNLMLTAIEVDNSGNPIVILDRNFKKYDLKELISSQVE